MADGKHCATSSNFVCMHPKKVLSGISDEFITLKARPMLRSASLVGHVIIESRDLGMCLSVCVSFAYFGCHSLGEGVRRKTW